jgi:hypothetical protein
MVGTRGVKSSSGSAARHHRCSETELGELLQPFLLPVDKKSKEKKSRTSEVASVISTIRLVPASEDQRDGKRAGSDVCTISIPNHSVGPQFPLYSIKDNWVWFVLISLLRCVECASRRSCEPDGERTDRNHI